MKQPKMKDLKFDKKGTKKTRDLIKKSNKIKITINFDSEILEEVKTLAEELGSPYQTLLNKIIKDALLTKKAEKSRLDRLEAEIKKLKKKLAA
jgi:predicted DNA binding CopG/RHH family protein